MPEIATAPAPTSAPAAADSKQTATNIAKGVQDKASGKSPARGPENPGGTDKSAPKSDGAAGAADPNAGKRKYVVEGKEIWLTPAQADAYVQKGIAFEPKISEIARMRQEIQQFESALINNPGKVLANLAQRRNIPIAKLVENVLQSNASDDVKQATGRWYYENAAKREMMDPKDREILEKDEKIRSLEERDKQAAEQAAFTENRNKVAAALSTVSSQIKETLGELGIQNVDSPMALRLTKEIADVMRLSYFSRQPCTAKQAAEKVRQRIHDFQGQFYHELDAAALVERLGPENVEKIRQHLLKAVVDPAKATSQEGKPSSRIQKRNDRETMNMDQFHDYLDNLKQTNSLQK